MKSLSDNKRKSARKIVRSKQSTTRRSSNSKTRSPELNHPRFIVVIGASAGGLDALKEMVRGFSKEVDAAYCIVLHLSRKAIGDYVIHQLSKVTSMPCHLALNDGPIEKGSIYIAPPNLHLLVKQNHFILGGGPEENRFRPSIDVLFRSAAVAYSSFAVGVILSGMLDDGTAGMSAVKKSGGTCIVQDPNQAEYPDMPLSVINNMDVDHVVTLSEIGEVIANITIQKKGKKKSIVPEEVIAESKIAETTAVGIDIIETIADKSVFACPDCGGNLWTMKESPLKRYRCHIGHAYTERDLAVKQVEIAGSTLWVALRMMEERKHLLKKFEMETAKKGYKALSTAHREKQKVMQQHIDTMKKILFNLQADNMP